MAFIAIFGAKLGNMNANVVVFFIGAMLGFVVGSHLAFSLIQLVTHSSILHSQRLLLGYHDALATLVEHQVDDSQAVDVA